MVLMACELNGKAKGVVHERHEKHKKHKKTKKTRKHENAIVPTLRRGNAVRDAPASRSTKPKP